MLLKHGFANNGLKNNTSKESALSKMMISILGIVGEMEKVQIKNVNLKALRLLNYRVHTKAGLISAIINYEPSNAFSVSLKDLEYGQTLSRSC